MLDRLLANLMLPDGAERQPEDWTIFFLNQTPFNTIAPVLALDTPTANGSVENGKSGESEQELLYVLNLVRTKLDKTVRRCVASPPARDPPLTRLPQRCRCKGHGYLHTPFVHRDIQGISASSPSCKLV